jgi:hypothetical protein
VVVTSSINLLARITVYEMAIAITASDEAAIEAEAMKLWTRLEIYAVGDTVEKLKAGDKVYITTGSLQNAEKVEIDNEIKLMLSEGDIAIIW